LENSLLQHYRKTPTAYYKQISLKEIEPPLTFPAMHKCS